MPPAAETQSVVPAAPAIPAAPAPAAVEPPPAPATGFIDEGVAPARPSTATAPADEQNPAESTTAAEPGTDKPATGNEPPESKPRSQRSFDRKIDKLTKRAAELEARAERAERLIQEVQRPAAPPPGAPDKAKFVDANGYVDVDAYAKAYAEFEKRELVTTSQRQQQELQTKAFQQKTLQAWDAKLEKADEKYADWDEVVPELKPDNYAAVAIMTSENGEDVAYHLFKDQAEARRIAALDPISQVAEIGKFSAKLLAQPVKPKEPPKLPAPIAPVNGSGNPNPLPSDSDDVNTWMKKENARMNARAGAR